MLVRPEAAYKAQARPRQETRMISKENTQLAVVVKFEFETEAEARAVVEELEVDERCRATEIRLADGRALEYDMYLEELKLKDKRNAGSGPL